MKKPKVVPWRGWMLIGQEEDPETGKRIRNGAWHVAWTDLFSRKHEALRFAKQNNWNPGYRAVRGSLRAD